jgi:hypothetical protein
MAVVVVNDVRVLNNQAGFTDPFQFEITFECKVFVFDRDLHSRLLLDPTPAGLKLVLVCDQ